MIIALLSKAMKEEGTGKKKKKKSKKDDKFGKVMGEYKRGELHSGSKHGPVVTSRKQAQAIAASEAGISYKKAMKPSEVSAELRKSYGPEAVSESPKRLNCWAINRALGIIMDMRLALTDAEIAVKVDQLKAVLAENLVEGDEKTLVLKKMEQLKMVNHMDERKIDPLQSVIRSLVEAASPPPVNKSAEVRVMKPSLFRRVLERLTKAKYIKRTGSPGNYKYQYKQGGDSGSGGERFTSKQEKHIREYVDIGLKRLAHGVDTLEEVKERLAEEQKRNKKYPGHERLNIEISRRIIKEFEGKGKGDVSSAASTGKPRGIEIDMNKMRSVKLPKEIKAKGIDSPEYRDWVVKHWAKDDKGERD